jgi:hypothetical protein
MMIPKTIAEQCLYAVKRIETSLPGGLVSVGTGYLCIVELDDGNGRIVLVTNKHVMANAIDMRILMHTGAADAHGVLVPDGSHTFLSFTSENCIFVHHADPDVDLCAIDIGLAINGWNAANPGKGLYYKFLSSGVLFPSDQLETLDVSVPITMIGCPSGLWDEVNGFPLFRRGVTASHPAHAFNGQAQFAIDIGVFSGSSGSPVFLWEDGVIPTQKGGSSVTMGLESLVSVRS